MSIFSGRLHAVTSRRLGSETSSDHPAGATVLSLVTVADFVETGGHLTIEQDDGVDVTVTYTAADPITDQITLAAGLTTALPAGTGVVVSPLREQYVGKVILDAESDYPVDETGAVDVQIPSPWVPILPEGSRGIGDAEYVDVKEVGAGILRLSYMHDEPVTIQPEALPPIPAGEQSVFFAATAPVGAIATDAVWFDTDNGSAMSRWDGTQWVPVAAGSAFFAGVVAGLKLIGGEIHAPVVYLGDVGARMILENTKPAGVAGATQRIIGITEVDPAEQPGQIYFRGDADGAVLYAAAPYFEEASVARLLLKTYTSGVAEARLGADVVYVDAPNGHGVLDVERASVKRLDTLTGYAYLGTSPAVAAGDNKPITGWSLNGLGDLLDANGVITIPASLDPDSEHSMLVTGAIHFATSTTRVHAKIINVVTGETIDRFEPTLLGTGTNYRTAKIAIDWPVLPGDKYRIVTYAAAATTLNGSTSAPHRLAVRVW